MAVRSRSSASAIRGQQRIDAPFEEVGFQIDKSREHEFQTTIQINSKYNNSQEFHGTISGHCSPVLLSTT